MGSGRQYVASRIAVENLGTEQKLNTDMLGRVKSRINQAHNARYRETLSCGTTE